MNMTDSTTHTCQICKAKDDVIKAKDDLIAAKDDAIAQKDQALKSERELREQLQRQLKSATAGGKEITSFSIPTSFCLVFCVCLVYLASFLEEDVNTTLSFPAFFSTKPQKRYLRQRRIRIRDLHDKKKKKKKRQKQQQQRSLLPK